MRLDRYTRVADFLAAAGDFLAAREAEHNLILGISSSLRASPGRMTGRPTWLRSSTASQVVMAPLLRTPPFNLILSEVDDLAALELVADDLAGTVLPGVVGPPEATRRFADRWVSTQGGAWPSSPTSGSTGSPRCNRRDPRPAVGAWRFRPTAPCWRAG